MQPHEAKMYADAAKRERREKANEFLIDFRAFVKEEGATIPDLYSNLIYRFINKMEEEGKLNCFKE